MKYYVHVLIVLLAVGVAGCGPESGEVRIDIEELLAKPKTYVGSDKCEFCHLEHYNSWENTLHSRTLQDVTENLDALVAAIDPAIIRSDLKRIEKTLRVPVEKIYIPKLSEIKYTLGMQWEQGFVVEKNGTLYVAPIKYSAKEEHWIAYREKDWDQRPWITKCAGCHVTGADSVSFTGRRLLEQGVRADYQPGGSVCEFLAHPSLLGREQRPCQLVNGMTGCGQHIAQGPGVLFGQELGWRHKGDLVPGVQNRQHRQGGDRGLSGTDISLHQTGHRFSAAEIGLYFAKHSSLCAGQHERQQLADPGFVE